VDQGLLVVESTSSTLDRSTQTGDDLCYCPVHGSAITPRWEIISSRVIAMYVLGGHEAVREFFIKRPIGDRERIFHDG